MFKFLYRLNGEAVLRIDQIPREEYVLVLSSKYTFQGLSLDFPLAKNVQYINELNKIISLYQATDLEADPSLAETLSIQAPEALPMSLQKKTREGKQQARGSLEMTRDTKA